MQPYFIILNHFVKYEEKKYTFNTRSLILKPGIKMYVILLDFKYIKDKDSKLQILCLNVIRTL